jgi:hypothetical protein
MDRPLSKAPEGGFIELARKPQVFKPGDEWSPGAKQWRSGGVFWHNLSWPDIGQEPIQNIDCAFTWFGYPNTEKGFSEGK